MMLVRLLLLAVSVVAVPDPQDPLLLEYSDYYYDLYYGDYDEDKDYKAPVSHSTAPRSIRVEKPSSGQDKNTKELTFKEVRPTQPPTQRPAQQQQHAQQRPAQQQHAQQRPAQ